VNSFYLSFIEAIIIKRNTYHNKHMRDAFQELDSLNYLAKPQAQTFFAQFGITFDPQKMQELCKNAIETYADYPELALKIACELTAGKEHYPEKISDIATTLIKYAPTIKKYMSSRSSEIATCLRFATCNAPEKLQNLDIALNANESFVRKYLENHDAIECFGFAALHVPEVVPKVIAAIERLKSKDGVEILCLKNVAYSAPEKLDVVTHIFDKSEEDAVIINYLQRHVTHLKDESARKKFSEAVDGLETLISGGDFIEHQKKALAVPETFFKFIKSYALSTENDSIDDEANKSLYNQGLELMASIRQNLTSLIPVSTQVQAEEQTEMFEEQGDIFSYTPEIKKAAQAGLLHRWLSEVQFGEYSCNNVAKLKSVMREILEMQDKNCDGIKRMAEICEKLAIPQPKQKVNGPLELSILPKSLSNPPTYQKYGSIAFKGYDTPKKESDMLYYPQWLDDVLNPTIQFVELKVGNKSAIAVTQHITNSDGNKVLWVKSLESKNHMFAHKAISSAALEGLKEYARKTASDLLLISDAINPASLEFYQNIENEDELKLGVDQQESSDCLVTFPVTFPISLESDADQSDDFVSAITCEKIAESQSPLTPVSGKLYKLK
jgi:hypothetical protein